MTVVGGTALNNAYTFSFMRRGGAKIAKPSAAETSSGTSTEETKANHPYENAIKTIHTVGTVEEFWETYNYLQRPNDLSVQTDYHFFREQIKPTWEDANNVS
jgi:hypothetical protein